MLEREREMAALEAALADAEGGDGQAVAIEASAGLGKTSLLKAARSAGEASGFTVLAARATEFERDFPFALVRQLFEPHLSGLPLEGREELLDGAGAAGDALGLSSSDVDRDPFAVLHGLYWVTAAVAERGPLLLAIDDLHWADDASLDYLGFLLPRLEELPVALTIAVRTDEPVSPPGLGPVLSDGSLRHLPLSPLSPQAAAALLADELEGQADSAFAEACHEVSGGNPFLLCELVRSLADRGIRPGAEQAQQVREQAPDRVARMVLTRISRMPPEAGAVARALAVAGEGSDHQMLIAMNGTNRAEIQRAVDHLRAHAIFDPAPSLRFFHPLVRNAIYADIPAGERSRAHSRAAEILRERAAGPERIATHLLATEERGERATAEVLLEAAEHALGAGAPRSAIAYLTRALREPAPSDLRPALLDLLLTASLRAADQNAFAAIEHEVLAEWTRDSSLRSRWGTRLTMLIALGGRFEEAALLLREAVEVAVAESDVEQAFRLTAQLNTLAAIVPSVSEVEIAGLTEEIDPESPMGRLAAALEVRSVVVNGKAEEVAEKAKRAFGNDGSIFAEEPEIIAAEFALMALVAVDEIEAAQYAAERALAIAQERGATPELSRARFLNGFVAWGSGDLVAAEADLRQAIDLARLTGLAPLVMLSTGPLVEVLIERDQLEAAEAELQAIGMAENPIPANPMLGMLALVRGHLRLERGEFGAAVEDFEVISVLAEEGFGSGAAATASPFAARALMALGREDRARDLAAEMLDWAERRGGPSSVAHVLGAVAAVREGREAIEALKRAVMLLEDSPRRGLRARALFELGGALRREGRRADSREPLREAFELARRCGAARIARQANEELRASGETVRRYVPTGVESLTPSERRVADLAASGMSNRQIAQSLFVTVKTVEAHLGASYRKLDIRSRRELPAALAAAEA